MKEKKRMTPAQARWRGETLRVRVSLVTWDDGMCEVDVNFVRDYLLRTPAAVVADKWFVPVIRTFQKHLKKSRPKRVR